MGVAHIDIHYARSINRRNGQTHSKYLHAGYLVRTGNAMRHRGATQHSRKSQQETRWMEVTNTDESEKEEATDAQAKRGPQDAAQDGVCIRGRPMEQERTVEQRGPHSSGRKRMQ